MDLFMVLLMIGLVGLGAYLFRRYTPFASWIKTTVTVFAAFVILIYVLRLFGVVL